MLKVILIADDEDYMRRAIRRSVQNLQAKAKVRGEVLILEAANVASAVSEIEKRLAASPFVDFRLALLTDGTMKEGIVEESYGDVLIERLQSLLGRERMPVTLMLSGDRNRYDKAIALGAEFLDKPLGLPKLPTFIIPFLEAEFD